MPRAYRHLELAFGSGEMAPEMFARLDDARYQHGAALLQNLISLPQGPARKRPGFEFVRETKTMSWTVSGVNFGTDEITTVNNHDIVTGDPVLVQSTGTVPSPLSESIGYFAIYVDANTIQVAATRVDAVAGDQINLADAGTGTIRVLSRNRQNVRLLPFRFGSDDTLCIEMSRTVSDSRFIGYMRFHTDGGTVTYDTPANYIEPQTVTDVDEGNDLFTTATHGLTNGDPIVLTMPRTWNAGFEQVLFTQDSEVVTLAAHGFITGQPIAFQSDGSLPPELVAGRTYYVVEFGPFATGTFAVAEVRYGPKIVFSTSGVGTDHSVTSMPFGAVDEARTWIDPGVVYYAFRPSASTTNFQLCLSHADATASTAVPILFTDPGTDKNDTRVHYAYEPGDLTLDAGGSGDVFYCIRRPWDTHLDHALTDTSYWYREPQGPDILEVPHYYQHDDLFEIQAFQSNDVVTLVHRNRPVAELRRMAADHWVLQDVVFNGAIDSPKSVQVATFKGEGNEVTTVSNATPATLTTATKHLLTAGDTVMIEDVGFGIEDGHYVVLETPSGGLTLTLKEFEDGAEVGSTGGSPTAGRIRASSFSADWDEEYAVTAFDDETAEESRASAKITATNNLLVPGSYNTIAWDPVVGADHYRVYKEELGLFGFIGEVSALEGVSFQDENIVPDLSRTLPVIDDSLYRSSIITVDSSAANLVLWADHKLVSGDPVLFTTDDAIPGGIGQETTYYVVNPSPDAFQISATPGGTVVTITSAGTGVHRARGGAFPGAGCYFEGRRAFAGAHTKPQRVWLTVSATESDLSYSIPVVDDDRVSFEVAAREFSLVRHLVPLSHLLALSSSTEYRVTPLDTDAITPSSVRARAPTHIGSSVASSVSINNVVLFVADRGGHVREMGLSDEARDYVTGDISLRASHLFDGLDVVQMAYAAAPTPIVWAISSDGKLLGLTYAPEERIGGWHRHTTSGSFRSLAVVSEGDQDRLYVVAERSIQGSSVRYIERMGVQDAGNNLLEQTYLDSVAIYLGAPVTTIDSGLGHLEGRTVLVLGNGVEEADTQIVTNGEITLTNAASIIHVGLPYSAELQTLPIGAQLDAALGSGRTWNVNQVWLRVLEAGPFQIGPSLAALTDSPSPDLPSLLTEVVPVTILGSWTLDAQVHVRQVSSLPLTIASLTLDVATGG